MANVTVHAIETASVAIPRDYVFRPGGPRIAGVARVLRPGAAKVTCPCVAFVVQHPSEGVILVDTGMHADAATDLRGDFGPAMSLMFRGLRPVAPFDEQLRDHGVDPGAVTRVVMTHLHVDHTSGMRLLPAARFVCARDEWAAASRPRASGRGYVGHHLPQEDRMELVDPAGGDPHGPFARTLDLLGDGSVRLLSTPGHTVGHLSVLLRTERGTVLLAGDAAYTLQSIDEERLPLLTVDDERATASLRELRAFREAEPDAIVVPSHDPDAWRALADR